MSCLFLVLLISSPRPHPAFLSSFPVLCLLFPYPPLPHSIPFLYPCNTCPIWCPTFFMGLTEWPSSLCCLALRHQGMLAGSDDEDGDDEDEEGDDDFDAYLDGLAKETGGDGDDDDDDDDDLEDLLGEDEEDEEEVS